MRARKIEQGELSINVSHDRGVKGVQSTTLITFVINPDKNFKA